MTFLQLYVLIILIIYLLAFFIQNLKTYYSVKKSIRGRSAKLTFSLVMSTIIYLLTFGQIAFARLGHHLGSLEFLDFRLLQMAGAVLITTAMLIGLAALYEMKNSWRVGIKYDQKTELVTRGIYAASRNPYFLSYDLLFLVTLMIFPSMVLLVLVISLMLTFHLMILEEEQYLAGIQGKTYQDYKRKTGRYLFGI